MDSVEFKCVDMAGELADGLSFSVVGCLFYLHGTTAIPELEIVI